MLDISAFIGPVAVTLGYVLLYYVLQIYILTVKTRLDKAYKERGEKFDRYFGQDREMLAADRMQLNMLEHMPPFLVLLWLNAAFVGSMGATVAGGAYLASRIAYPLLVGSRLGRSIPAQIMLATAPGYLVLIYFTGALLWAMAQ